MKETARNLKWNLYVKACTAMKVFDCVGLREADILQCHRNWVVLPIGWKFDSSSQKHFLDLGSEHHQHGILALTSLMSFHGETIGDVMNCWLFSQAMTVFHLVGQSLLKTRVRMTIYLLNMFHRNCLLRTIKIAFHLKSLGVRLPHSPPYS